MRRHRIVLYSLVIVLGFSNWAKTEDIPLMIPHSGTVSVNGTFFNGPGQFKFAIVDTDRIDTPNTFYWSNDGTVEPGAQPKSPNSIPTDPVLVTVTGGAFSLKLGDTNLTNMIVIPASVFNNPTTYLRVWFNDGTTGFQRLIPDRQLVSVPYAYRAEVATSVSGSATVGSNQIAPGAVTSAQIAAGAVTSAQVAPSAIGLTQIDTNQVQKRISGTCPPGSSVRTVHPDGTVDCELDDIGIIGETDPTAVKIQAGSPGTPQGGHLNITGTGLFAEKIGVGTANPFVKLHIAGSPVSSGANPFFDDGLDRPTVGIRGEYPNVLLMSRAGNSIHGPTLTLGSYDSGSDTNVKHYSGANRSDQRAAADHPGARTETFEARRD
jgi:hypothetical protein